MTLLDAKPPRPPRPVGRYILLGLVVVSIASLATYYFWDYPEERAVKRFLETVERVRGSFNPLLSIEGVVLTMFDERTNLGKQVVEDIRSHLGEKVFETVIPRNVRLGEAPSFGKPVLAYDIKSRGAEAYLALAREYVRRLP